MKMQTVISGTESFVMLSLRWRRLQQHCLSGLRGDIQNIVLIIIRLRNAERLQRAWYDENVPQINEAYEQGNFADISEVTADSYKNKILQQWKHYNILYIYKYAYSDTLRYDDKIAQGTPLESYEFENLYRSCMEYMNMLEDTDGYMYRYYKSCDTQEKEIISMWTQHVKAVLTDTIGQSEADYAADYQALYGNGDVSNYNMFREKAQKYEK